MKRTFLAAALLLSFASLTNADDDLLMLAAPADDIQAAGDLEIPDLASLLDMDDDAEANALLKDDDLMAAFDATQTPEEAEAACWGWGGYRHYGYRHYHYRSYCYPRYYRTYTYHHYCAPTYYVPRCYTGYWCY